MEPGDRSANTFTFSVSDFRILSLDNDITVKIADGRHGLKHNNMILGRGSCRLRNIFGPQLDGESTPPGFLQLRVESRVILLTSLGDRVGGTVLLRFSTGPFTPLSEREELRLNPLRFPAAFFLVPPTGPYSLPTGWEMRVDLNGRKYFVDRAGTLSYKDPRKFLSSEECMQSPVP